MRLLFWYSGEHPTMPAAEARAAFEACGHSFEVVAERPRFQCVETSAFGIDAEETVRRLGLAHDVSAWLFDAPLEDGALQQGARACCFDESASFAVRAERLGPDAAWRRTDAERRIGGLLSPGRRVDLKRPAAIVRAFVDADHVWVGKRLWDRDPKDTAAREVENRPAFSPVSLPPKLARALVNLARVPPGGVVCDPVCGTGGILLEAAAMGTRAVGSDLDPLMVEGTRKNLAHYGFQALGLFACDVGAAAAELERRGLPPVDAVVMDLPYGRSASTGKERTETLYQRAFEAAARIVRPGGRIVAGLPREPGPDLAPALRREALFQVWVHRSLTRHFLVLERTG